jgi:hypothetical protein
LQKVLIHELSAHLGMIYEKWLDLALLNFSPMQIGDLFEQEFSLSVLVEPFADSGL